MKNCFVNLSGSGNAPVNLFLFPFAGGTAQSYRFLSQEGILTGCSIYALELPGRGMRMSEPYTLTIDEIKEECLRSIKPYLCDKMVFMGHSMGAIIAYELLGDLEVLYPQLQFSLILSAANSPRSIIVKHDISKMTTEEFKHYVKNMGGIPAQISENESLLDFFLPRIRNDFELLEQYKPQSDRPLNAPITVIAATDDVNIERDNVLDWEHYAKSTIEFIWCEGGHFYLYENQSIVIQTITDVMQELINEQRGTT